MLVMKMSDQIMRDLLLLCAGGGKSFAQARGEFLVDAVEAAIGEDGDDIAGRELRRDGGDDGVRVGEKLGRRACGVEGADDFLRVQALGLRNALLLIDGGENGAIGEAEALDEVGGEDFAAQRVGSRLQNGPDASPKDKWHGVPGEFRGWPWGDAQSLR